MNCGIIAIVMGIMLNIIRNFFDHCSKSIIGKKSSMIDWVVLVDVHVVQYLIKELETYYD